jgi:2-polyprenyl-3-methyl-5-hydroxy-6-metoxy-1,4-benzoquinol methylase
MAKDVAAAERWREEAEFFDGLAQRREGEIAPLDLRVIERYRGAGRLFPKEYYFRAMGDLRGKTVLDVGCGEGADALLLAALGAKVTAIDVSPKAIELARTRARASGLEEAVEFICAPLETAKLRDRTFDVVCGDNVLHHLLPVLDETMAQLVSFTKDDGRLIFMEPMNLNPTLRKIRFLVPVHTETTPGERPLEKSDMQIVEKHIGGLQKRHFTCLGRLTRFILPNMDYENAPFGRRPLVDLLCAVDYALLSIPKVETLGGMCVFYGQPRRR